MVYKELNNMIDNSKTGNREYDNLVSLYAQKKITFEEFSARAKLVEW